MNRKKRLGGIYEKYCKNAILPWNHNFLINVMVMVTPRVVVRVRIRVRVRIWMMGILSEDEEEDQIKRVEWTWRANKGGIGLMMKKRKKGVKWTWKANGNKGRGKAHEELGSWKKNKQWCQILNFILNCKKDNQCNDIFTIVLLILSSKPSPSGGCRLYQWQVAQRLRKSPFILSSQSLNQIMGQFPQNPTMANINLEKKCLHHLVLSIRNCPSHIVPCGINSIFGPQFWINNFADKLYLCHTLFFVGYLLHGSYQSSGLLLGTLRDYYYCSDSIRLLLPWTVSCTPW